MNRSVPFVLWLIPIVFLVVELGDQGLLGEITFWFLLVVVCLFAARSLGIIGENSDRKEEPLQPRSREEIEEVERAVQPYVVVQGSRSDGQSVEFEGRLRKGAEKTFRRSKSSFRVKR